MPKRKLLRVLGIAIVLFVIFAVTIVFAANVKYGWFVTLFFALAVTYAGITLYILSKRLSIEVVYEKAVSERRSYLRGKIVISNRTPFVCLHASAGLSLANAKGQPVFSDDVSFSIRAKGTTEYHFDIYLPHIGVYQLGVSYLSMYDMFHMFRRNIPVTGSFDITVLPKIRSLDELEIPELRLAESRTESPQKVPTGNDYIGIRKYEIGDSMKLIHWKLSAHASQYLTKIFEHDRDREFAVILDLSLYEGMDAESRMSVYDSVVETALSLFAYAVGSQYRCSLTYYAKDHEILCLRNVDREDLLDLVWDIPLLYENEMQDNSSNNDQRDALSILEQWETLSVSGGSLLVCTARVTDELMQAVMRLSETNQTISLFYILPPDTTPEDRLMRQTPLYPLMDADVPCFTIVADE